MGLMYMGYNKKLDKVLFNEIIELSYGQLIISVHSYDGASPKLQISRKIIDSNSINWTKLGRLTKHELEQVIPIMTKALEFM
jgi:hypothetical protein